VHFVPAAAGTLRLLAVTTATRSEALPDLSTVGELLPGYEASGGKANSLGPQERASGL
jgi:hypothetical protein